MPVTHKILASYPHDSVITSVEQVTIDGNTINIPVGDRPFPASAFASLLAACYSDGILDGFDVTYSDGVATVSPGHAIIGGLFVENDRDTEMTLGAGMEIRVIPAPGQATRNAVMTVQSASASAITGVLILCARASGGAYTDNRDTAFCPLAANILIGNITAQNQIITGGYVASPYSAANTVFSNLGYRPKKIEIFGNVYPGVNGKMEITLDGRTNSYKYMFTPSGNASFSSQPTVVISATNNGITINGTCNMYVYETQYCYVIYKSSDGEADESGNANNPGITTENFTIDAGDWTAVSEGPFTKVRIITVTSTIGTDSVVSLGGISVSQQAIYGIVIGGVTGQQVTIYAINEPPSAVSGEIIIMG